MASDRPPQGRSQIPVTWRNVAGQEIRSTGSVIGKATEADIRRYSQSGKVCGECRFFEHGHGQHEMRVQRFMDKLVKDYEWKPHHLCSPQNQLGLCGQTSGESKTITGPMHAACDHFRENRGRLRTHTARARREPVTPLYSDGTSRRGSKE